MKREFWLRLTLPLCISRTMSFNKMSLIIIQLCVLICLITKIAATPICEGIPEQDIPLCIRLSRRWYAIQDDFYKKPCSNCLETIETMTRNQFNFERDKELEKQNNIEPFSYRTAITATANRNANGEPQQRRQTQDKPKSKSWWHFW